MSTTDSEPTAQRGSSAAAMVGFLTGLAAATPSLISPVSGLPLRPWHLCVLLALGVAFLRWLRLGMRFATTVARVDIAVVAFFFVTLFVEQANAGYLTYAADYPTVARPVFWLLVYWSARMSLTGPADACRFLAWFCAPALPSVLLGFAQVLGIEAAQDLVVRLSPDSGGFIARLEDGRLIRATALVQHWTSFGSYLCTVVAAGMSLLILARRHQIGSQGYAWTVVAAAGLGTIATFTLSSILTALLVFLVCSAAARATMKAIPLLLIVAVVGTASLGSLMAQRMEQQFATSGVSDEGGLVPSTLRYRYKIWVNETIPMVSERPITGWGTDVYEVALGGHDPRRIYPYQLDWPSPESQWFNLLMTYGALGLAFFLGVLGSTFGLVRRAAVHGDRWIARPTMTLLALMSVAAFTAPVFTNHGLPIGLWALLGVCAATTTFKDIGGADTASRRS